MLTRVYWSLTAHWTVEFIAASRQLENRNSRIDVHTHTGTALDKAGIPRRRYRHRHGHPREDPRRHVRTRNFLKLFLYVAR